MKANKRANRRESPHSRDPKTVEAIGATKVGRKVAAPAADVPEGAEAVPVDTEVGVPEVEVADLKVPDRGVHSASAWKINIAGPAFRKGGAFFFIVYCAQDCPGERIMTINVVVHGVLGKMGQQVLDAVTNESGLEPVGGADIAASAGSIPLPDRSGEIPISSSLADVLGGADVVVDFTNAEGAMAVMRTTAAHKVNVVVGSTGLTEEHLAEAESLANEHSVGIIVAPNFALGAVLMIHLAKEAAKFFDYADLVETHHEAKIDSPSGTALAIARAAVEGKGGAFIAPKSEKELIIGARGAVYDGVSVHSARMPGRVAHHELVFGTLGQTLTIRHDSINRESFMPGVMMAVKEVVNRTGLTVGLEKIMGL